MLDEYIKHGKKKKIVRKIFHFVNYDEYENEKIKELLQAIQHEKIQLPEKSKSFIFLFTLELVGLKAIPLNMYMRENSKFLIV